MRMIDGKPVVDADKPVIVHITPEDCARGSKKDPEKCAVALALRRITKCDESRVHLGCTYLRFGNKWLRYTRPTSLKAEIIFVRPRRRILSRGFSAPPNAGVPSPKASQ